MIYVIKYLSITISSSPYKVFLPMIWNNNAFSTKATSTKQLLHLKFLHNSCYSAQSHHKLSIFPLFRNFNPMTFLHVSNFLQVSFNGKLDRKLRWCPFIERMNARAELNYEPELHKHSCTTGLTLVSPILVIWGNLKN